MGTASPIAKMTVGKSGYGPAHASYITRLSALDPCSKDRAKRDEERLEKPPLFTHDERERSEPSARETLKENLNERSLSHTKEHSSDRDHVDPIWTLNAPRF